MQTKTYFASSVPAALEVARRELGEDALLVNSKVASPANSAFGRLEVTFAFHEPADHAFRTVTPRASEMDEIREQLAALRKIAAPGIHAVASQTHQPAESRLCAAGFDVDLAREIALASGERMGPDALWQELESRIPKTAFAPVKPDETRTIALVGPPGRGKSATLVKIAFQYGLAQNIPVHLYSAGSHSVGCQEQMARYAAILGVPFEGCESLESLHLSLNGAVRKGLVLIDTPGLSPADQIEAGEFARFFARRPEVERHLVLRADSRSADMLHVVKRFFPLGASRLLFTGLDEALNLGAMATTLIKSGIPASLIGNGQQIPENLEEINVAALARAICAERTLATAAAA